MAPRTSTTHLSTLSFPSTGTLSYPVPASPSSHTTVHLPQGSKFDSELHWHEAYTEFFRVNQGVLKLLLESPAGDLVASYVGPGSGVIEVPRGRLHRLRRADQGEGLKTWSEGLVFKEGGAISSEDWEREVHAEEWNAPADGRKECFFRNLAGVVGERAGKKGAEGDGWAGGAWRSWDDLVMVLGVFAVMREFDNWPAFLNGRLGARFNWVEWVVSHVVLAVGAWVGGLFGAKGLYEEYTPKELLVVGKGRKDL